MVGPEGLVLLAAREALGGAVATSELVRVAARLGGKAVG